MLEISRMLTISTAHVTPHTLDMLSRENDENNMGLTIYPKNEFGYFIYLLCINTPEGRVVDKAHLTQMLHENDIPKDLSDVLQFCSDMNCDVLCLDSDGDCLPYLPNYEDDY